jgi:hypothetical protein
VRDDLDLALDERRIGLDALDERRAARRRRERPLEDDQFRLVPGDRFERLECIGIVKRQRASEAAVTLERWQMFWRCNEDRVRHRSAV